MPDTKPDLRLDGDGVCNACRSYEQRAIVDWEARRRELDEVLARYRCRDGAHWDCIVPVSGGKDSTYQVIQMLELGMTPLAVTATTCDLSAVGRRNLLNLRDLGVDHVEFSPNPVARRRMNRIGLTEVGDISWPEHVGIFTIPVRAAVQFGVPLIVWGENSQNEYGGPAADAESSTLTRRWLEEFGGLLGLRVSDLLEFDGLRKQDLIPYTYPSDEAMSAARVTGIFLGHYLPWDGLTNTLVAEAHGFESLATAVEGSMVNYENLDNHQTGIHDYFKFLKFGFGRATDLACLHLRRGRLTRAQAVKTVLRHDGKFPWTYLGKPIAEILRPLDLDVAQFAEICDRFTNKKLFVTDSRGELVRDASGSLQLRNPPT